MNTEQINVATEKIIEQLGTQLFLDELLSALNNDELTENLEYIARMWDVEIN